MNGHYVRTGLDAIDREIVRLVAEGLNNREIGTAVSLSPDTVKKRLVRIGEDFGNGQRAAIVAVAFRRGILQ